MFFGFALIHLNDGMCVDRYTGFLNLPFAPFSEAKTLGTHDWNLSWCKAKQVASLALLACTNAPTRMLVVSSAGFVAREYIVSTTVAATGSVVYILTRIPSPLLTIPINHLVLECNFLQG